MGRIGEPRPCQSFQSGGGNDRKRPREVLLGQRIWVTLGTKVSTKVINFGGVTLGGGNMSTWRQASSSPRFPLHFVARNFTTGVETERVR
jgi:hypothetical protein